MIRVLAILATSLTAFFGAVGVAGCGSSDPRGTVSALVGITKQQYDTWSVGDYYPTILTESGIRKVGR